MILREQVAGRYRLASLLGTSPAMPRVFEFIGKTRTSVLITGESGTGEVSAMTTLAFAWHGCLGARWKRANPPPDEHPAAPKRTDDAPEERQPEGWPPDYPPRLMGDLAGTDAVTGTRRWLVIFADHQGTHGWRADLEAAGLEYVRTCVWIKAGATPQLTGDRLACGHECLVIAHQTRKGSP